MGFGFDDPWSDVIEPPTSSLQLGDTMLLDLEGVESAPDLMVGDKDQASTAQSLKSAARQVKDFLKLPTRRPASHTSPSLTTKVKVGITKATQSVKDTKVTTGLFGFFRKLTAEEKDAQICKGDAELRERIQELQEKSKQEEIERKGEKHCTAKLRKRKSRANQCEVAELFPPSATNKPSKVHLKKPVTIEQ